MRKAFRLILVASLCGLAQMHFHHEFRRHLRALKGATPQPHAGFEEHNFKAEHEQKRDPHQPKFLNEAEDEQEGSRWGRHLRGDRDSQEEHHRSEENRGGEKRHGGPGHDGKDHRRGGHGMKKALFAVLLWLALVLPFLKCFKRFTFIKMKLHKVNHRCNDAQRSEVNRSIVDRLANSDNAATLTAQKKLDKATAKAVRLAEKAKKAADQMQKFTKDLEKQEAKKAKRLVAKIIEKKAQQMYCPPLAAPLLNTTQVSEESHFMMPPQEANTYTLDQVQALLSMERERLLKQ